MNTDEIEQRVRDYWGEPLTSYVKDWFRSILVDVVIAVFDEAGEALKETTR